MKYDRTLLSGTTIIGTKRSIDEGCTLLTDEVESVDSPIKVEVGIEDSKSTVSASLNCSFCHRLISITTSILVKWFTADTYRTHLKTVEVQGLEPWIKDGSLREREGSYKIPLFQTGRICLSPECRSKLDSYNSILPESDNRGITAKTSIDTEPMYLKEGMKGPFPTERERIFKSSPLAVYEALIAQFKAEGRDWNKIVPPRPTTEYTKTFETIGEQTNVPVYHISTPKPRRAPEARKRGVTKINRTRRNRG